MHRSALWDRGKVRYALFFCKIRAFFAKAAGSMDKPLGGCPAFADFQFDAVVFCALLEFGALDGRCFRDFDG